MVIVVVATGAVVVRTRKPVLSVTNGRMAVLISNLLDPRRACGDYIVVGGIFDHGLAFRDP